MYANEARTECIECTDAVATKVFPRIENHDEKMMHYDWLFDEGVTLSIRTPCLCKQGIMNYAGRACVECSPGQIDYSRLLRVTNGIDIATIDDVSQYEKDAGMEVEYGTFFRSGYFADIVYIVVPEAIAEIINYYVNLPCPETIWDWTDH